jgi:hypothetical protein
MPEPTTRRHGTASPEHRVHVFLQRWDRGQTVVENAGDSLTYSTLAALLADFSELTARAAVAEAAVQRVREWVACTGEDVTDWQRGYRSCSERAVAALDLGSAGQPVGLAGKGGADAATPALPADPAPTSVSAIVNAAPDDQPVTVTGWIHHIEPRANHAHAPYVELVLVGRDAEIEDADPDTVKVVVPAPVYAGWDFALRPREGMLVEVTGRAAREVLVIASGVREVPVTQLSGGEPVWDRTADDSPPWLDWTEQDETARGGAL